MSRSPSSFVFWAVVFTMFGIGGLLAYIYSGAYDVSATKQHIPPIYWILSTARRQSIRAHAGGGPPPAELNDAQFVATGLDLYERHCSQCHGAPGIAPAAMALGMNPSPPNLAQMGQNLPASEIYWSITNGIKMTGMPAWQFRLSDRERWSITAFLKSASTLSPAEYQARRDRFTLEGHRGATSGDTEPPWTPDGAVQRGRVAIQQYACPTCHVIPGIRGADTQVGPPLSGIAERVYLAGVLLNTRPHMVDWLRNPQGIRPLSAMPNLGVTESDARDIAAYLYSLH